MASTRQTKEKDTVKDFRSDCTDMFTGTRHGGELSP